MATPPSTSRIVPEVLGEDNYEKWRILMQHYLESQDLWDVVLGNNDFYGENSREWCKKNASALHAIKFSCGAEMFDWIKNTNSAAEAWNALAEINRPLEVAHPSGNVDPIEIDCGSCIVEIKGGPQPSQQSQPSQPGSEPSLTGQGNILGRTEIVTLLNAIYKGDIPGVQRVFDDNENAKSAILILENGHTALHVAITAGKEELAVELINNMLSPYDVMKQDNLGNTALSLAARNGMKLVASVLASTNSCLLTMPNNDGKIPVVLACGSGYKEVASYLYSETRDEDLNPESGNYNGLILLQECITNKMFDIALDMLRKFPKSILYRGYMVSPLLTFARIVPQYRAGSLVLRLDDFHVNRSITASTSRSQGHEDQAAEEVLNFILAELSKLDRNELVEIGAVKAAFEAIKHGNLNFVISITKANPDILWCIDPDDSTDMLAYAIAHRQEDIARFLYGFGAWKDINARNMTTDEEGNNMFHLAAKLAPDFQLSRISGATLQLQNELRWFKAVESIVPQCYKELKNKDGYSPSEIFPRDHKDLRKEAEKWMKETAKSCTVIGGFIITIMFAAAFTIPGGNDQVLGLPIFLSKKGEKIKIKIMFVIFVVSDAVSLLTSTCAVLRFLGILTSRYNWQDFLITLPFKLASGIFLLLISIVAMMITFCVALFLMLQHQYWAVIPISVLSCVPVYFFGKSQFPLLTGICTLIFSLDIFKSKKSLNYYSMSYTMIRNIWRNKPLGISS